MLTDGTGIEKTEMKGGWLPNFDMVSNNHVVHVSSSYYYVEDKRRVRYYISIWDIEEQTDKVIYDIDLNFIALNLEVSPDGSHLSFNKVKSVGAGAWENEEIWVVGIDGSNPRHLVYGEYPTWSPDSQRIAFNKTSTTNRSGRENKLFVINVDGSKLQVLFDFDAWHPSWSPWLDTETSVTSSSWGQVKREHQTAH